MNLSSEARLGNPLSDDSLLLDDGNTSSIWIDSESEPAIFRNDSHLSSINTFANTLLHDSEQRGFRCMGPSSDVEGASSLSTRNSNGVFNVSGHPRFSFSYEDAQIPLLNDQVHEDFQDSMKHCHSQLSPKSNDSAWRRLLSTSLMCAFFMIAELVGGHFAGSLAIMTDAAHLMSDLIGLLVSLSAVWLGQRPPTRVLSFGYHRAEVLGALFSIIVIWFLTGIFVYLAVQRLLHGDFDIHADRMMAVAAGGIVINIVMALVLHGGCHQLRIPHSHGFSHQHLRETSNDQGDENQQFSTQRNLDNSCNTEPQRGFVNDVSQKKSNINIRAATIHVLGDLLQSIGVFVSAIIIKFNPDAKMVDPICTFLFAIIVLFTTLPLLRDTGLILLEGFPHNLQYCQVLSLLRSVPGVHHVHSLHVWSLTVGTHSLTVHLAVDSTTDRDAVTALTQSLVAQKLGIQHCTIQIELFNPTTMHSCKQCQPLVS